MKPSPLKGLLTALLLSSLVGCSSTPVAPPSSSSSSSPSSSSSASSVAAESLQSSSTAAPLVALSSSSVAKKDFVRKTYYDAKAGFTFWHPSRMTVIAPKSFYTGEGEMGYQINDPSHFGQIWVSLKPDTTTVNRNKTVKDVYAPPGGNLSRDYVFFTNRYRVSVYAHYDVFPPLYESRNSPGNGRSITELVEEDLSGDLSNPIKRLIAVYPNEKTLKEFYQDSDAIVLSMASE